MADYQACTIPLGNPFQPVTTVFLSTPFTLEHNEAITPNDNRLHKKRALWDTGANGSCITSNIVNELGLSPIDETDVTHGGGTERQKVYLVNFYLPNGLAIPNVKVTEQPTNGQFDLIVGMNIIAQGNFSISNYNRKPHLSFIFPPNKKIDHLKDAEDHDFKDRLKQTSKNQKCPCGSGKKAKQCHKKK